MICVDDYVSYDYVNIHMYAAYFLQHMYSLFNLYQFL